MGAYRLGPFVGSAAIENMTLPILAEMPESGDIALMAKNLSHKRSAKSGRFISAGRASDGVVILEQVKKPRHFTLGKAERVMERVKSESKTLAGSALTQRPANKK